MTTRDQIENHSRAAFYLDLRAGTGQTAQIVWGQAARAESRYLERAELDRAAQDSLAALWESLGKVEPQRYSPEGEQLAEARNLARVLRNALNRATAYRGTGAAPYVGTWQPGKPGLFYVENPGALFRGIETADSICHDLPRGYYDNPHGESARDGSGLVLGVVAQLPGRNGCARFIAGYQYGSHDGDGATFDTLRIFESMGDDYESAWRDAARAADGMAETAGERERDYQAAWQAGAQWQALGDDIAEARAACLALLAERRAAMAEAGGRLPAICAALRDTVAQYCRDIAKARAERAELAEGQRESLWWSWSCHDESGLVAFSDGAGLTMEKARGLCS